MFDVCKAELYVEAKSIFDKYHLKGHVTPVSEDAVQEQLRKQRNDFLSLAIPLEQVILVQDAASLSIASIGLLDADVTISAPVAVSTIYRYVGVDAEWRAVMSAKGKPSTQGASILQISTPQHVYIFDFKLLASSELLIESTIRVLSAVFSSEYIIKVGWGFGHNDKSKVQLASGGTSRLFNMHLILAIQVSSQLVWIP